MTCAGCDGSQLWLRPPAVNLSCGPHCQLLSQLWCTHYAASFSCGRCRQRWRRANTATMLEALFPSLSKTHVRSETLLHTNCIKGLKLSLQSYTLNPSAHCWPCEVACCRHDLYICDAISAVQLTHLLPHCFADHLQTSGGCASERLACSVQDPAKDARSIKQHCKSCVSHC